MNERLRRVGSGLPVVFAALVWLIGCAAPQEGPTLGQGPGPVYDTAEQIRSMPACRAVVVERGPCYVRLRSMEGNELYLGSPAAGNDVIEFLQGLKDGRTYRFPEAFRRYEEQRQKAGN